MAHDGRVFEWVEFDLPKGTTREAALALYHGTAARWAANADLVCKTYVFDEARSVGGGLYVWRDRDAAARWHGDDYRRLIMERYGSAPRISVTDAVLDIRDGTITTL